MDLAVIHNIHDAEGWKQALADENEYPSGIQPSLLCAGGRWDPSPVFVGRTEPGRAAGDPGSHLWARCRQRRLLWLALVRVARCHRRIGRCGIPSRAPRMAGVGLFGCGRRAAAGSNARLPPGRCLYATTRRGLLRMRVLTWFAGRCRGSGCRTWPGRADHISDREHGNEPPRPVRVRSSFVESLVPLSSRWCGSSVAMRSAEIAGHRTRRSTFTPSGVRRAVVSVRGFDELRACPRRAAIAKVTTFTQNRNGRPREGSWTNSARQQKQRETRYQNR